MKEKRKKPSKWKELLIGILVAVLALAIGCWIYINDGYSADEQAMAFIENPGGDVHLIIDEEGRMIFEPDHGDVGIIFYPGGKVEAESYAPLMADLAERGILAALVPMPANLAVFDVNAAEGIVEEYEDIQSWYMAGHSLGGSMAASYLSEQIDHQIFEGIILLAAYSTKDLNQQGMRALSIYGDQDKILSLDKYEKYFSNLPEADTTEVVIEGGNHSQFGSYGPQEGDGEAEISAKEQRKLTVDAIETFVN